MGRGQEVTSSQSGWGECGRHARERRAHAPGPAPPPVERRRAAAGQGEGDRAGGGGPTAGCLRPAALSNVSGGRGAEVLGFAGQEVRGRWCSSWARETGCWATKLLLSLFFLRWNRNREAWKRRGKNCRKRFRKCVSRKSW